LYNASAHNDVTQNDLVLAGSERHHTTYTHDDGESDVLIAAAAMGCHKAGVGLPYPSHVSEYNIVAADGPRGIGIWIARGFVVGVSIVVPVVVKQSFYSIGLDRKGADDGDLEFGTPNWA
jgi:hypothetical protein